MDIQGQISGSWKNIQSSDGGQQSVKFTTGVSRLFTVTNAYKWGKTAGDKAGASFIIGASTSSHVSSSIAKSYMNAFTATTGTTKTFTFTKPGVVWQWQFIVETAGASCGKTVVGGSDLVLTEGQYDKPCCLPGYMTDITNPGKTACCDGPRICTSPTPTTTTTGAAPPAGNYECSWWSSKCESSFFGSYTSKSMCENESSCKPSPMDSTVV